MEDNFDDIEAPPGPYKLQPENQGEIKLHLGFFFLQNYPIFRQADLVFWSPRNGKVNNSPNSGQGKWLCLLRSRLLRNVEESIHSIRCRESFNVSVEDEVPEGKIWTFGHGLDLRCIEKKVESNIWPWISFIHFEQRKTIHF